jgi:hypothetical protein
MLCELRPKPSIQGNLFAASDTTERSEALMFVMDQINNRWGRGTLKP